MDLLPGPSATPPHVTCIILHSPGAWRDVAADGGGAGRVWHQQTCGVTNSARAAAPLALVRSGGRDGALLRGSGGVNSADARTASAHELW